MPPARRELPLPMRLIVAILALPVAAAVWLPALHLLFTPDRAEYRADTGIGAEGRALLQRHLTLWQDPVLRDAEVRRMRQNNAEWDFMGRTFLVLALANAAERDPALRGDCLEVMDRIIDETLAVERERGHLYFLMDYARSGSFLDSSGRSVFVDGEIALMLAVRQLLEDQPRFREPLRDRINTLIQRFERSPLMCGESYPNECWTFCNAVSVAAIRVFDAATGEDHSTFVDRWLSTVRGRLTDQGSGMLVSSFTLDGYPIDGPEGSSIFLVAHCLQLVDSDFASAQYALARQQLGRRILGFGYAREWPASWEGPADVDSGPIVPGVQASAGASGLAILGAAAFDDAAFLEHLLASLHLAAFPVRTDGELRFAASNQVGDAVLAYAMVEGPVWDRVRNALGSRDQASAASATGGLP